MKPLNIKELKEGECFICKEKCEGYCHYHCAFCLWKEKEKRIKEAREE